jgi:hypothetical protein
MSHPIRALGRFCLEQLVAPLSRARPRLGSELDFALREPDDTKLGEAAWSLLVGEFFTLTPSIRDESLLPKLHKAVDALREGRLPSEGATVLARIALVRLRDQTPPGRLRDRFTSAAFAADVDAWGGVLGHLDPVTLDRLDPGAGAIVAGVRLVAQRALSGVNLSRGRKSRADLVMAVLRSHDVQLRDPERGRIRIMTRDDLAEAILRDPFWDDIDASTQEDGVVDGILRHGRPSPAIDGTAFGQKQVYIQRIVR